MNNMNQGGLIEIIPDAQGTYNAFRSMGYENIATIADLMDNSIDANASEIRLTISDLDRIIIADNGSGMSYDVLCKAIQIGGKKVHDSEMDLGKYGLGLITASLSMGTLLKIITSSNGTFYTAVLDYDIVKKTNKFLVKIDKSTETEIENFALRTGNATSGTVVIINHCDRIEYASVDTFIKKAEDKIPQIFRSYIRDGKKIFINDKKINYIDPLFLGQPGTIMRVDKDIEINTPNGLETMHVLAVTVPDHGKAMNKKLHLNIPNQGFYIMRNNREIVAGYEFAEVFKKHNDFNLLRIELNFNSRLDEMMGVNIKKHDITPNNAIINDLIDVLSDTVANVRKEAKLRQKKAAAAPNPFKTNSATKMNTSAEATSSNGGSLFQAIADQAIPSVAGHPAENSDIEYEINTRFKTENDPLFEITISGNTANIWYNGNNRFYADNIINNDNGMGFKKGIDDIICSVAKSCLENHIAINLTQQILNTAAQKITGDNQDGGE